MAAKKDPKPAKEPKQVTAKEHDHLKRRVKDLEAKEKAMAKVWDHFIKTNQALPPD